MEVPRLRAEAHFGAQARAMPVGLPCGYTEELTFLRKSVR